MAGTKDHYMPLQMLPDQLMALTAARSVAARVFTEAESAQNHCQIGNMDLALKVILAGWTRPADGPPNPPAIDHPPRPRPRLSLARSDGPRSRSHRRSAAARSRMQLGRSR
jgi:hypothetical protein